MQSVAAQQFDVVVLGAGAAGLMCAAEAGRRGRRVLLLDHADRVGKKILISGGGRSNFTNLHCRPENFISENPHFAKSALAQFTPADMIALVERHGISYHEKTLGQLFCDRSSRDLVAALEADCHAAHVKILLGAQIASVRAGRGDKAGGYTVNSSAGTFEAASVVVATGGLSIPKMGATGLGMTSRGSSGCGSRPAARPWCRWCFQPRTASAGARFPAYPLK